MLEILLDFLPSILFFLAVGLILFGLLRLLKSNTFKGWLGEKKVAWALRSCMLPGDKLINDLYLINPQNGMSSQIDHLLISTRGLFVVETKNISGVLYGNNDLPNWTQVLANGNVIHEFYNPVKQNGTHISTLKKVLKTDVQMENIIVFVQVNTQKIDSNNVRTLREIKSYLCSVKKRRLLTKTQCDEFYDILRAAKKHPAVSKRKHRKNIKRNHKT